MHLTSVCQEFRTWVHLTDAALYDTVRRRKGQDTTQSPVERKGRYANSLRDRWWGKAEEQACHSRQKEGSVVHYPGRWGPLFAWSKTLLRNLPYLSTSPFSSLFACLLSSHSHPPPCFLIIFLPFPECQHSLSSSSAHKHTTFFSPPLLSSLHSMPLYIPRPSKERQSVINKPTKGKEC